MMLPMECPLVMSLTRLLFIFCYVLVFALYRMRALLLLASEPDHQPQHLSDTGREEVVITWSPLECPWVTSFACLLPLPCRVLSMWLYPTIVLVLASDPNPGMLYPLLPSS